VRSGNKTRELLP
jgi:hypothetical protein